MPKLDMTIKVGDFASVAHRFAGLCDTIHSAIHAIKNTPEGADMRMAMFNVYGILATGLDDTSNGLRLARCLTCKEVGKYGLPDCESQLKCEKCGHYFTPDWPYA